MTTKKEIKSKSLERQYGLLTILSMVVGIVIGSGIFVKNQSLYDSTSSSLISISAWVFMSFIVLFMVFAFVEIASISKHKREPGTLHSWTRDLINPRVGRLVGYFYVFAYFPILLVSVSSFATKELMNTVNLISGYSLVQASPWGAYFLKFGVASLFLVGFALMNMKTSKPGKIFQVSGTAVKLIPLVLLSFTSIVIVSMVASGVDINSGTSVLDPGAMWDPYSVTNTGMQGNDSLFKLFILALPGVMFAFNGFIWSASLQGETKKQSTYQIALMSGMLLVAFLYVSVSWAIFAVFPYTDINNNGVYDAGVDIANLSVTATFLAIFPNANWLAWTISLIIVVSIATGLSGSTIASARNVSSLSEKNMMLDANGKYLQRNKALVPENSAKFMLYTSLFWLITLTAFDAINIGVYLSASTENNLLVDSTSDLIKSTNYSTDIITIFSYTILASLLVAGVWNRKTNKVKVEKSKVFIPFSIISSVVVYIVIGYFAYLTINPVEAFGGDPKGIEWFEWVNWATNMLIIIIMIGLIVGAYWYFDRQLKSANKKVFTNKQPMIEKDNNLEAWIEENYNAEIKKTRRYKTLNKKSKK